MNYTEAVSYSVIPEIEHYSISKRELEILKLLSVGKKNKEIAKSLYISQETVKKHLQNIFAKLQVSSRIEAVIKLKLI